MYISEAAEAETVAVLRLRAAAKIFLSICSLSSFEKRKTQEAGGDGGLQFVVWPGSASTLKVQREGERMSDLPGLLYSYSNMSYRNQTS